MSWFEWKVGLYSRRGFLIRWLDDAYDRKLSFELNGIDSFSCSVPLDGETADAIEPLTTFIRVWRTVDDNIWDVHYRDEDEWPCFAGIVGSPFDEDGEANRLTINAYSPYWVLQHRYHIVPHRFEKQDPSSIMWGMVMFTNRITQDIDGDFTGILGPHMDAEAGTIDADQAALNRQSGWSDHGHWAQYDPPVEMNQNTPRGQNTWQLIQDVITQKGMPDLVPRYTHVPGKRRLAYFNTAVVRGLRKPDSTTFDYRIGKKNCTNMRRRTICEPGRFATYVAAQGQGDTDRMRVSYPTRDDVIARERINDLGLYMAWTKHDNTTRRLDLRRRAQAQYERMSRPPKVIEVELSPALPPYFGANFALGDALLCNSERGNMSFRNLKQRVYKVDLDMSDANVETCRPTIAKDFTSAVPDEGGE